jgi:trehalose synthase
MSLAQMSDLWWKNAVVYCLDVETFYDSNGDGWGDLTGLIERIEYLADLGVTCLWLMPFYPSPGRDDGYDITDFYAVDPSLGTLGDFVVLIRTAKDRGLRVIIDLVVNHTSDRHPWFRQARVSRSSSYRDYYVWRDERPPGPSPNIVFPDAEDSIWTWDERAGQWYLHHFYANQPDLNYANPAVRAEIEKIAGFWMELGVDGFRIDAVPFLLEEGGQDVDLDPHDLLKDLRSFISRRNGGAMLLGEVNLPPRQLTEYFGAYPGDQLHMLFNFPVMQRMYLALAREDARPLARQLKQLPEIPPECQWANFIRNHDELTLDQLTERQQGEVADTFGPDEDMQLFGRGLRRRLPPMLDGNLERMRMTYSVLLSLPGTPVLFYGEEIGMGENLSLPGRLSVRTPMQWSRDKNGGFSTAPPSRLRRQPPSGRFGPLGVNVADQQRDPDSMLIWMERMIRRRRETPELGWGTLTVCDTDKNAVLAHRCDWEGRSVIVVHNFSASPTTTRINLGRLPDDHRVDDLLSPGLREMRQLRDGFEIDLQGFDHRWFRIETGGQPRRP